LFRKPKFQEKMTHKLSIHRFLFFLLSFLVLFANMLTAQNGKLTLSGKVKSDDGIALSEVTVLIFNDLTGRKIPTPKTDKNGDFSVSLDLDSIYSIKFSKSNYLTKKIAVDTKVPEGKENKIWQTQLSVILFEEFQGVDYSEIKDKPTTKIRFETVKGVDMFTHDAAYKAKMDNFNKRIQIAVNEARDKKIRYQRYLQNLPDEVRESVIKSYTGENNPDSLLKESQQKANEIITNANDEANEIKTEADKYADSIQLVVNKTVDEIVSGINYTKSSTDPNEQARYIILRAQEKAKEIIEDAQQKAAEIMQQAGVINSSEAVNKLIEQRQKELVRLSELQKNIKKTSGKEPRKEDVQEFEDILRNQRDKLAQDRYQLELLRLRAKTHEDSLLIEQREQEIMAQEQALQRAEEELDKVKKQMLEQEIEYTYKLKRRNYMLASAAVGIFLLILIVIIVIRNNVKIKRLNKLLEQQKEEIEEQNNRIQESLKYARRIQNAILPNVEVISSAFKDAFVLFKPREKVSGDFYWFENYKDMVYFSVVDCTGHGVPGAFMSLIGYSSLSQALKEENIKQPSKILQRLDELITKSLHSQTSVEAVNDGMDLGLCSFNPKTNELEFAGAFNPLYIIRQKTEKLYDYDKEVEPAGENADFYLYEIKGDKYPIGGSSKYTETYNNHKFLLQKGDTIYISSDGFTDQFGGLEGKKFKMKPFRDMLLSLQKTHIRQHGILVEKRFEEWIGSEYEQVDDICIMGIKI